MDNGNEPAYPVETDGHRFEGLTKREYFAAMAMQGMVAHTGTYGANNDPCSIASRAVECADFLLAELGKEGK